MVYDTKTLEILHPVSDEDRKQFEEMIKREKEEKFYQKIIDIAKPTINEKLKPFLFDKLKKFLYNKLKNKITSTTSEENNHVS